VTNPAGVGDGGRQADAGSAVAIASGGNGSRQPGATAVIVAVTVLRGVGGKARGTGAAAVAAGPRTVRLAAPLRGGERGFPGLIRPGKPPVYASQRLADAVVSGREVVSRLVSSLS
jgi:hypothetical protein